MSPLFLLVDAQPRIFAPAHLPGANYCTIKPSLAARPVQLFSSKTQSY
jgi:hypothetical protein